MMGVDDNWGFDPEDLIEALESVRNWHSRARLIPNALGNLVVCMPLPSGGAEAYGFITLGKRHGGGVTLEWTDAFPLEWE